MGVVTIKKIMIFILISVMFITMSIVSAENITDTSEINMENDLNNDNLSNSAEITKTSTLVKTSTSNNKTASKISIDSQSVKYNTTTIFNSKVTDKNGNNIEEGTVVYKINGKTIGTTEVKDGLASLTYSLVNMTPKTYNLTVKYSENSYYLESRNSSVLTLLKHNSKITVSNVSVITRDVVKLTAKIEDVESDNVAISGKVAFKINGKTIGYTNVSKGIASYNYNTSKLSAKLYNITASYGGNYLLNSIKSDKSVLNVSAIPTVITVNAISGYSTSVVLKATVVEKNNLNYVSSGIVLFKINDKTVGNASFSNGKVSFTYNTTQLARGTYKITASLKPTSTYSYCVASNNLTINAEDHFTFSQIKSVSVDVRTQFEANNSVSTVYIGKSRIALSEFLALMIQATKNLYNGNSAKNVSYTRYKTITTQTDSLTAGVLNISQIIEMGDRVLDFMNTNGKPPKYASTVFGNMGYYNIVYSYSKILDVSTSEYIVSTCRVYPWKTIHPASSKSRTIYLTSDMVYNSDKDYAFMNKIKTKLESYGYTVVINGYGPNSHVSSIWNGSLPVNAVQLSIFSGADAGVIYDISTRSFMRTKENRLMFFVYYSATSVDITGMKYLKRAHDDNYSSSSFEGIAYPDIYLKNHGYDYVYTTNVNTIVNSLIKYIT